MTGEEMKSKLKDMNQSEMQREGMKKLKWGRDKANSRKDKGYHSIRGEFLYEIKIRNKKGGEE